MLHEGEGGRHHRQRTADEAGQEDHDDEAVVGVRRADARGRRQLLRAAPVQLALEDPEDAWIHLRRDMALAGAPTASAADPPQQIGGERGEQGGPAHSLTQNSLRKLKRMRVRATITSKSTPMWCASCPGRCCRARSLCPRPPEQAAPRPKRQKQQPGKKKAGLLFSAPGPHSH